MIGDSLDQHIICNCLPGVQVKLWAELFDRFRKMEARRLTSLPPAT